MSTKLYVGNLPYQTTEADLQTLFEASGQVASINVVARPRHRPGPRLRLRRDERLGRRAESHQGPRPSRIRRPQPDGQRSQADDSARQRRRWRFRRSAPRIALVSTRPSASLHLGPDLPWGSGRLSSVEREVNSDRKNSYVARGQGLRLHQGRQRERLLLPPKRHLRRGHRRFREGDSVEFQVGQGPKGPRAENVRRTST